MALSGPAALRCQQPGRAAATLTEVRDGQTPLGASSLAMLCLRCGTISAHCTLRADTVGQAPAASGTGIQISALFAAQRRLVLPALPRCHIRACHGLGRIRQVKRGRFALDLRTFGQRGLESLPVRRGIAGIHLVASHYLGPDRLEGSAGFRMRRAAGTRGLPPLEDRGSSRRKISEYISPLG